MTVMNVKLTFTAGNISAFLGLHPWQATADSHGNVYIYDRDPKDAERATPIHSPRIRRIVYAHVLAGAEFTYEEKA